MEGEHIVKELGGDIRETEKMCRKVLEKAEEIKLYLAQHPHIRRYVILDDCFGDNYESDKELQKHLVFVDALKGLQQKDLMSACDIMNML